MPTATYIALANTTLTGTATSITFSSIPSTYRDLVLVWSGNSNSLGFQFNGDTGSNYPVVQTQTSIANSISSGEASIAPSWVGWSGNNHMFISNIMDYSATDKHKTVLTHANINIASGRSAVMQTARWANSNAINSIRIFTFSGAMESGVQIALYGIVS